MHKKNLVFISFFFLAAWALSACSASGRLAATSWPGVTATEDHVYIAFASHIYSLDAADGRMNWQYPVEADNSITFFAAPALAEEENQLIAGGYDNTLYSINPESGALAGWSFSDAANRYIAEPLILDDRVYAANADGRLYALNLDGEPVWDEHFDTGESIWAAPAANGNTIYIASLDHHIRAIDAETGEELWSRDLETATTSAPTYAEGALYVGTFGSRIFALDTDSGEVLWDYETGDWVWASPAYSDGIVYAGDISGILYAIDAGSGESLWTFPADGGIYGGPLVIDGTIYFGTVNGQFYALTSDGSPDWSMSVAGEIYSPPKYNGEYIFIATIEGEDLITAIDLSGTARWRFAPEE